ncbi:heterokaryon incompatibility protein-domain-containing protein [Podospora aff. communis PSN243]|uniref:Heterokaryon incompatibility protein-domain-containing protein n=1 Tax=Podospora aff. communis PSN243 TaxID=3040156 RepID=A0AAV9H2F6_9PEZI|nr:heterokaryon incompatibility protein-domain-containing protein [Podospora aff. communis PSN243]
MDRPSLIVTVPYHYCRDCTDVLRLQRWCNERALLPRRNVPEIGREITGWTWFIRDLKTSARHCRCCNFLLETLAASPWMRFEDDDLVVLSAEFVSSKMSGVLETPAERDSRDYSSRRNPFWSEDDDEDYLSSSRSSYERYCRPTLMLYKKLEEDKENDDAWPRGSHRAVDVTFILPLATPDSPAPASHLGKSSDSQMFHGRPVAAYVNPQLVQQWFQTCSRGVGHRTKPEIRARPRGWRRPMEHEENSQECLPSPRRRIPHFRLIDVRGRYVITAQDNDDYAALSYVWGDATRLLLTAETLERLSTPGALSSDKGDVPRTFKDALAVAKQLDIAFLWIDALCVMQDDEEQLVQHMDAMDSIYSSANLTIVSDAPSADSGIPGVSLPRGPPQAILKCGSKPYISAKRTFGKALSEGSCWESRAWCLQEKLFSPRLLVFTEHQAFYHCAATTWFEDTIMEPREHNRITSVSIAERAGLTRKERGPPQHTAYEAHQKLFERNFLPLLEIYTKRQLSFESDIIRAFSGILSSMESKNGPAIWGVPEYCFTRGVTWSQSPHKLNTRRAGFPSWSWAGWRGNTGSAIRFGDAINAVGMFGIDWHHHKINKQTGEYELTPMHHRYPRFKGEAKIERLKHKRGERREEFPEPEPTEASSPLPEPSSYFEEGQLAGDYKALERAYRERERLCNTWAMPGHPGEPDYIDLEMPAFVHDSTTMPPMSHIIRFFTSCARVWIDSEPNPEYAQEHYRYRRYSLDKGPRETFHAIRSVTPARQVLGHLPLDPAWDGKGKEHELVYISPSFWPPCDDDLGDEPMIIWVMLVEDLEGAPGVKSRVSMHGPMDITTWRLAKPEWKCVTLA